ILFRQRSTPSFQCRDTGIQSTKQAKIFRSKHCNPWILGSSPRMTNFFVSQEMTMTLITKKGVTVERMRWTWMRQDKFGQK
ncbi:MAG: hypothetical protein FWG35_03765, partial [Spirochaetaceae bacterium]|nr:hypothetical protein [Spirochaetaceae bacterium]